MPARGETIEALSFEIGHGGKGANQAVAAARLGAAVVFLSKVGDDMFGDVAIRNLAGYGIDPGRVSRVKGRSSGVATIMVEPSGENAILIVKGANADLSPADIERAAEELKSCGLILLQLEIPIDTVYAAIAFGKKHGVKTLLNPAPAVADLDPRRIRDVSFLAPNETELANCPVCRWRARRRSRRRRAASSPKASRPSSSRWDRAAPWWRPPTG